MSRVTQNSNVNIEGIIAGENQEKRKGVENQWKETKLPGFFESRGISFKLSFPNIKFFKTAKDTPNAIDSSFAESTSSKNSFSFKNFLGKFSMNFSMKNNSASVDGSKEDVARTTSQENQSRSYFHKTSFNLITAQEALKDPKRWHTG